MLIVGDSIETMKRMDAGSVQTCVTSPPYYGLRDYGSDGQIGQEGSPQEYVEKMVHVCREIHRVLRDDGTFWLNLGDSYSPGGRSQMAPTLRTKTKDAASGKQEYLANFATRPKGDPKSKPKNLLGIPWRVALALQADGWFLRQDIIWHKPNPMPESVRDRCVKSHEYIFLLTKSAKYHFDHYAIQEPLAESSRKRLSQDISAQVETTHHVGKTNGNFKAQGNMQTGKRNKRSVWTVTTKPFKGAHFATFPPNLIEPCILAGCPPGGVVMDPFMGSGTTGLVAAKHGRRFIGIDLNQEYVAIAARRLGVMPGVVG